MNFDFTPRPQVRPTTDTLSRTLGKHRSIAVGLCGGYTFAHKHAGDWSPDCLACAVRACPHNEPLHYDGDGCPACHIDERDE